MRRRHAITSRVLADERRLSVPKDNHLHGLVPVPVLACFRVQERHAIYFRRGHYAYVQSLYISSIYMYTVSTRSRYQVVLLLLVTTSSKTPYIGST